MVMASAKVATRSPAEASKVLRTECMSGSGGLGRSYIVDKSGYSATGDAPTTFGAKRTGHANETRSQVNTTLG